MKSTIIDKGRSFLELANLAIITLILEVAYKVDSDYNNRLSMR